MQQTHINQLDPVVMWLPGVLFWTESAFICLWLVFYLLVAGILFA
jgi:hypothetical protein